MRVKTSRLLGVMLHRHSEELNGSGIRSTVGGLLAMLLIER